MTGVAIAVGALLALLAWLVWPSGDATGGGGVSRPPRARAGVDEAELEAAEREVQEAPDEESVRDWGPGASRPPLA
jgi:hypothetical protein